MSPIKLLVILMASSLAIGQVVSGSDDELEEKQPKDPFLTKLLNHVWQVMECMGKKKIKDMEPMAYRSVFKTDRFLYSIKVRIVDNEGTESYANIGATHFMSSSLDSMVPLIKLNQVIWDIDKDSVTPKSLIEKHESDDSWDGLLDNIRKELSGHHSKCKPKKTGKDGISEEFPADGSIVFVKQMWQLLECKSKKDIKELKLMGYQQKNIGHKSTTIYKVRVSDKNDKDTYALLSVSRINNKNGWTPLFQAQVLNEASWDQPKKVKLSKSMIIKYDKDKTYDNMLKRIGC